MTIREQIQKNPNGLLARAASFARGAGGVNKSSASASENRVFAVGEILNRWRLDETLVAAGMLSAARGDSGPEPSAVREQFGDEIATLLEELGKFKRIRYQGEEEQAQNLRKLILSMIGNLRPIFLKLARVLAELRAIGAIPPKEREGLALGVQKIYAPLASLLGMHSVSGELYDRAFPVLRPKEYEWLRRTVEDEYNMRERYLKEFAPALLAHLGTHDIRPIALDFRAKRHYSLYEKLLRHEMDLERIYDLVALRLIMRDVPECYAALGVIHQAWAPLPGRIKDYIAKPKANSYRSLHTTVIGPKDKRVEIQIRTERMHEENENGIAAHWLYEQRRDRNDKPEQQADLERDTNWIRQLRLWIAKYLSREGDVREFLTNSKFHPLRERVFVLTPKGDVIDLPKGATPVDFAYHIHTDIGNSCAAARINGKPAHLQTELVSGDVIEIIAHKNRRPAEEWLRFVKSPLALEHIRAALKKKNQKLFDKLRIKPKEPLPPGLSGPKRSGAPRKNRN